MVPATGMMNRTLRLPTQQLLLGLELYRTARFPRRARGLGRAAETLREPRDATI